MKVAEHRRDVVELSCFRHHPNSCVLDRLKLLEQTATSTVQQAVTVIQAADDDDVVVVAAMSGRSASTLQSSSYLHSFLCSASPTSPTYDLLAAIRPHRSVS